MNRIAYIFIIVLIISGCSKVEATKHKLTGAWEIISYKRMNPNGLTTEYTPLESKVVFGDCGQKVCDYSFDMIYDDQGNTLNFQQYGTYEFVSDDGEYYNLYRQNGNQIDTLLNARIILITKDDLMTEFGDETGRHTFVLQK